MFEGGVSKSFSIFPIRVVYMPVEQGEAPASILISVSKRRFKRAVKRNRVKRQIREAYRKNKSLLVDELQRREQRLAVAFIYLSDIYRVGIRYGNFEKGIFLLPACSHLFLPDLYFTPYSSLLSVHAYLFSVCARSN